MLVISDNIIAIIIIIIPIINISIGISVRISTFLFSRTPVAAALVWMVELVKLVLPGTDSDANVLLVPLEISVKRLVCIHTKYKSLSHVLFDLDLSLPDSSDFRNTLIKLGKWDGKYYSCCSSLCDKSIFPADKNHQVKLRPIYRCGAVVYKENTVWLYLATKVMKEFTQLLWDTKIVKIS